MADVNVNFPPSASPVRGVTAGDMESAVTQAKAEIEGQISEVAAQLTKEAVKSFQDKPLRPMMVLIDDDGKVEFLSKIKPLCETNGIKFSIAVNTNEIGKSGNLSMDQLKTLQGEGYEVLSHGHQHFGLDSLDEVGKTKEVLTAQNILKENGFPSYKHIVLGNGTDYNKNPNSFDFLKKYVKSAVNTSPLGGGSSAVNIAPIEQFSINRIHTPDKDLATLKAEIDKGVANNALIVFFTHAWQDVLNAGKISELDQAIKYAKGLNVPIVSLDEALKTFGNVIDTATGGKGIKVSNTGATNIMESKTVFGAMTGLFNKPITDYPLNKVSVEIVGKTSATESPTPSNGGTRITHRHSDQHVFCFQEWRSTNSDTFYRRRALTDGTWGPWETFSPSILKMGGAAVNVNTKLITDYELNKITIETCSIGSNAGLPESKSGVMKTYRVSDQHVFCYREFKANNGKMYTQAARTDGTWYGWLDPMGTPV